MKRLKHLTASILAVLTLFPALNVSAELQGNERKDLTYSEMQYHEFDESKLKNAADELTEIAVKIYPAKKKELKN